MTIRHLPVQLGIAAMLITGLPALSQAANTEAPAKAANVVACDHCGTVTKVTPHNKRPRGSGLGLVTGAVVGGLVGNQFGKGSGNTLATVGGAVAGGAAGNEIEREHKKYKVYTTAIRMDDGTVREITLGHAYAVGTRVTVHGNKVAAKP